MIYNYYTYTTNKDGINNIYVATKWDADITATSKKDFKTAIKNLKRKLKQLEKERGVINANDNC